MIDVISSIWWGQTFKFKELSCQVSGLVGNHVTDEHTTPNSWQSHHGADQSPKSLRVSQVKIPLNKSSHIHPTIVPN